MDASARQALAQTLGDVLQAVKLSRRSQRAIEKAGKRHAHKKRLYVDVSKPVKHKKSWVATATFTYQGKDEKHTHPIRFPATGPAPKLKVTSKKLMVTEHYDGHPLTYFYGDPESKQTAMEKHHKTAAKEDTGPRGHLARAAEKLKHKAGHLAHMIADPFKKAHKLITSKEYRKEVKDFVVAAAKKEARETKSMLGTFKKVLTGAKVTTEEKTHAIHQAVDLAKVGVIAAFVHHEAAHGILKLLAAAASPIDEIVAMAIDPHLRKITKLLSGREHGILPSAFYDESNEASASVLRAEYNDGDAGAVFNTIVDTVVDQLAKNPPTEDEIKAAIEQSKK